MKTALKQSIYYSDYALLIPIEIFEYNTVSELTHMLKNLSNNINVVTNFDSKKWNSLFETIPLVYKELLLDQVSNIYLVNRNDVCIQFKNTNSQGPNAIIKIDAVLSEMNNKSWKFLYPAMFLLGAVTGIVSLEYIKGK